MKYIAPIDPHVHLRGSEYQEDYLSWGLDDAKQVGLVGVIEMPNPQPFLTTNEAISERMNHVTYLNKGIEHRVHVGLTNDTKQIEDVLRSNPVSDKIFYTHSTGNMGLLDHDLQKWIWQKKVELGYDGVSIGHFEDEKVWDRDFDPTNPLTHSLRQTPESETIQVERQLRFAADAGFKGKFYIAHASNPETIELVTHAKNRVKFPIIVEATFHHIFLNWDDYQVHGNRVKMNPPLRSRKVQELLLDYVLDGMVDIIGTDHAPHPIYRKDDKTNPASGIPAIPFWPKAIELLRKLSISEILLRDMTFETANRIFDLWLPPKIVDIEYDTSLWDKYGYNPFSRLS